MKPTDLQARLERIAAQLKRARTASDVVRVAERIAKELTDSMFPPRGRCTVGDLKGRMAMEKALTRITLALLRASLPRETKNFHGKTTSDKQ